MDKIWSCLERLGETRPDGLPGRAPASAATSIETEDMLAPDHDGEETPEWGGEEMDLEP